MVRPVQPATGTIVLGVLCQLIEIGERAGLTEPADRSVLIDMFAGEAVGDVHVQRALEAFQLNRTAFYVCVMLFSSDPIPRDCASVANGVGVSAKGLGMELECLRERDLVWMSPPSSNQHETQVGLTDLGREIVVYAIYRVLRAAQSDRPQNDSIARIGRHGDRRTQETMGLDVVRRPYAER